MPNTFENRVSPGKEESRTISNPQPSTRKPIGMDEYLQRYGSIKVNFDSQEEDDDRWKMLNVAQFSGNRLIIEYTDDANLQYKLPSGFTKEHDYLVAFKFLRSTPEREGGGGILNKKPFRLIGAHRDIVYEDIYVAHVNDVYNSYGQFTYWHQDGYIAILGYYDYWFDAEKGIWQGSFVQWTP